MAFSTVSPFVGTVPPTVPLPKTPLTGVLVQVRFPEVHSIAKAEYIADFQEHIRSDYPLNHTEQEIVFAPSNAGTGKSTELIWRFLDKESNWRITLTTSFIAVETRAYKNRLDFTRRASAVMRALSETINPGLMTRVGVRYVDRIHGPQQEQLSRYIRPEVLGLHIECHKENLSWALSEVVGLTDVGIMKSRWGLMPANHSHEQNLMPPIAIPSWFLDVDVYNELTPPENFESQEIETRMMKLATRAYGFFRWAVSDDFLKECGGEI